MICFRSSCVRMESGQQQDVEPDRQEESPGSPDVLPRGGRQPDLHQGRHRGRQVHHGQRPEPHHLHRHDQRGRDVQLLHHVLGQGQGARPRQYLFLARTATMVLEIKHSSPEDPGFGCLDVVNDYEELLTHQLLHERLIT